MKERIMEALAPLSYLAALAYLRWATSRRWGRVGPTHPDAAHIGRSIYEYRRRLGIEEGRP